MSIALTASQTRFLRGQAHDLKALLQTGGKGVTPAFIAELNEVLERHELVKVKVAAEDRDARDMMIGEIVAATESALVQRIGHVALNHEPPDYAYSLRAADGRSARVNDQALGSSFFLTPDQLVEHWPVKQAAELQLADLEPILALNPALIVLGTGDRQVFPPAVVMAACLSRGIGLEVMNNPAAARTFNILAAEGRKVAAAFILEG
ncbi:hypothetical protein G6F57_014140 [Rhizopus arrhizus]|nr:hypothetical protein G6F57_014140 [Rhizopus arrhizus]